MQGKLIVFEGLDNSGKTSQIEILDEIFTIEEIPHCIIKFPYKNALWDVIDSFNSEIIDLNPEAAHLLYCANIWQEQKRIKQLLNAGHHVIIDRYLFSGIAYSVGYNKINLNWACQTFNGIIMPDLIFYMESNEQERVKRKYNKTRFETIEIQRQVEKIYKQINKEWITVENNGSIMETSLVIQSHIKNLLAL